MDRTVHFGDAKLLDLPRLFAASASNVAVETDAAGNLKPSKKKSTERIDGIVAGVMALGRSMLHQPRQSIYETQGLVFV